MISQFELKLIILKDIKKLDDKECAEILGISKREFRKNLLDIRNKLACAVVDNEEMIIYKEPEIIDEICDTKCTFRCATCSKIYEVDYTKEEIMCPLCMSKKIMSIEEIGHI